MIYKSLAVKKQPVRMNLIQFEVTRKARFFVRIFKLNSIFILWLYPGHALYWFIKCLMYEIKLLYDMIQV